MGDKPESETRGDLAQQILDRMVADPAFREQLLKNPVETLAQAGYTGGDDVSGYIQTLGSSLGLESSGALASDGALITTAISCTCPPAVAGGGGSGGGGGGLITTGMTCGQSSTCDPPQYAPTRRNKRSDK